MALLSLLGFWKNLAWQRKQSLKCSDRFPNMYAQEESDRWLSKTVLESHPIMVSQQRFCTYTKAEYDRRRSKTVLESHPTTRKFTYYVFSIYYYLLFISYYVFATYQLFVIAYTVFCMFCNLSIHWLLFSLFLFIIYD